MVKVTICMGSSCFSRGNNQNLEAIRAWLEANGKMAEVTLKGCRCGGQCNAGPNVWINDVCYRDVTPARVPELLAAAFTTEA